MVRATKLKISFVTSAEANRNVEKLLYKAIAKVIFEESIKDKLNENQKEGA